ncbi:MAG: hypothetical protein RR177_00580 [Oscillospiraceae bacterium]
MKEYLKPLFSAYDISAIETIAMDISNPQPGLDNDGNLDFN